MTTTLASRGRSTRYAFGDQVSASDTHFPANLTLATHTHDVGYACIVLDGSVVETVDGREKRARAGCSHYVPPGAPHTDGFGPNGARCLLIEVGPSSADLLRAVSADPAQPWTTHGGCVPFRGLRLFRLVRAGLATTLDVDEFLAFSFGVAQARRVSERGRPRWLVRVQERLDADIASPPRLATLARIAGVHPMHLTRVFRAHLGCSLGEYVQTRRVATACRMLLDCDTSLVNIGMSLGYYDQCHFTRAFTSRIGVPPGAFRALSRPA